MVSSIVMTEELLQSRKIFNRAFTKAEVALHQGDLNSVLAWAKIASHFAFARHPGFYTSPRLEAILIEVAQKLPDGHSDVTPVLPHELRAKDYGKMRFLDVVTEGYKSGGHCAFIARWANNTSDSSVHSLMATSQNGELPDILSTAINASGGWYTALTELSDNLVDQAVLLRAAAKDWADVIVLFTHPYDPLPTAAFGIDGGAPIILCNHADHAFWLGTNIADVIADYHPSGASLSARRRGISRSKVLPIPLQKIEVSQRKAEQRASLGIAGGDVMLFSVGRDEKFLPFNGIDFLEAMVDILKRYPQVKLFVAGPNSQGKWREASDSVKGRIRALGLVDRSTLDIYYEAADLYVASFPCGSFTALLEAGMHNLPLIGLHIAELPHLSAADDVAFGGVSVHVDSVDAFKASLESMIGDIEASRGKAEMVRKNIEMTHCLPGWNGYLDDVLQTLPSQHSVRQPESVDETVDYADLYFSYVDSQMLFNELPEHSFSRLIRAYAQHLRRGDVRNTQAKSFLHAFIQVDSFRRSRQFFTNYKEFIGSTFK